MSPSVLPSHSAAVLYGPHDLRVDDRTVLPPGYGHVQVAIACTGLCGSDLHYYLHARNGDFVVQAPMVLGHEAAGVITAIGPGVKNLSVGQRVAIEAGIMCKNCNYCAEGRYNLCKGMRFCSSAKTFPHLDGTLQGRMNHPAHIIHPLPENCSFERAALAEPLSVLIHATRRAQLTAGQTVLVFGVGAIGVLACAIARSLGARKIVALDINQARLKFAKANGFCDDIFVLSPSDQKKTSEEQLRIVKDTTQIALSQFGESDGFDVVFECTGAESAIQMSVHAAITGGKVMLIGMGSRNVMLPLSSAATREVDILGSFRYANTYPKAIELLASESLQNIERLITHRFPLSEAKRAFDTLARGQDDDGNMVLKVIVESS